MNLMEKLRPKKIEKWPPLDWQPIYDRYNLWSAFYSGDPARLAEAFASVVYDPSPKGRFWAKQIKNERQTMVHIPLAGDIATVSADLLFSEPPEITISEASEDNAPKDAIVTQERLDKIISENGTYSRFIEAAETAAALGGVFLKVNWDKDLYNWPILSVAQVDSAIPSFKWGMLQSVSFFDIIDEELRDNDHVVYRHLEKHQKGQIINKLYVGTKTTLGKEIPLEYNKGTEDLEPEINTGIDDLLVRYIPNKLPNRLWRGSDLGQSDYSGLEGMLDSLDEAWTSWMRDLRMAKSRILVPEYMLNLDEDNNFYFDEDKEVYSPLAQGPPNEKHQITLNQFEIRADQHEKTILNLIDRIVSSAGYSPQSFGLNIKGRAESGSALRIRERKSIKSQIKKQRYFKKPLEDLLYLMLQVDYEILGNKKINPEYRPQIDFADGLPDDPSELADSLQKINQAQAMSVETKVRWLHQDWNEEQIQAEVKRIMEEQGMLVEEPDLRI